MNFETAGASFHDVDFFQGKNKVVVELKLATMIGDTNRVCNYVGFNFSIADIDVQVTGLTAINFNAMRLEFNSVEGCL